MRKGFIAVSLLVTALALLGLLQLKKHQLAPIPDLGVLQDFSLTDSQQKAFGRADLKDNIWVASFVFTHCKGECPVLSGHMQDLNRRFKKQAQVHFVSISVDPSQDTPQSLAEYATSLQADTTRWHFLTGTPEAVSTLMVQGFKIGSGDQPSNHSMYFVLLDGAAHIRAYYDGMDAKAVKKLGRDITRLLDERSSASAT